VVGSGGEEGDVLAGDVLRDEKKNIRIAIKGTRQSSYNL
jgi:hypothetical protein